MVWTGPSVRPSDPDPVLADLARAHGIKPDRSRILGTDALLTALNREQLGQRRRFVDLSCGHKVITRNWKVMECPRCAEMIRQGCDYEGWINNRQHTYDGMIWRADPCRHVNEPSDLAGVFIEDPEG